MKKLFSMFLAAALGGIALAACGSDPAEALDYNTFQTATIQGKVLVNTDYTLTAQKWSAPTGITVIAEVANSSITGQNASGTYRTNASYNATTGEYSVSVPVAYTYGSQVTIIVKDWTGRVRLSEYDSAEGQNVPKDYDVLWHSRRVNTVTLYPGDVSLNNNILFNNSYTKLNVGVGTAAN